MHPNVQEKLAFALSEIAAERELSVVLSTHSPFILRGAPLSANVYWLENGALANDNREAAEIALGWGAFGKKVIIVSEDKNIALLKKVVSQWPELDKFVTYHPGQGYKNLMKKEQAIELYEALGRQYKILVHRDRDSLTDNEVERLVNDYESDGIKLWFPEQSDIEAYFCSAEFIAGLTGNDLAMSQAYIDEVLDRHGVPARDQFNSQRQAHNQELYAEGGSPPNDEVWQQFQARPLRGYKGKYVFKQLKNFIPGNSFSESIVVSSDVRVDLANDLRGEIEQLIVAD